MKDVQKKLRNYGDVCYTADETTADYVFFVHTKPAVYHGVQTTSSTQTGTNPVSGTVTDQNGNTSTINGTAETTTTTTTSVPYEVDYSVFILNIMVPHQGSAPTALHTFDQKNLYNKIYGIGYGKGKNPIVNVIDAAAKWLHENNLGKGVTTPPEGKPVETAGKPGPASPGKLASNGASRWSFCWEHASNT